MVLWSGSPVSPFDLSFVLVENFSILSFNIGLIENEAS
jgi:hypothetical protein